MISSKYKLSSYTDFLVQLADLLGTTYSDNQLLIPETHGSGYFRLVELGNGLQALVYDFLLNDTFVLRREQDGPIEYYTLVFDDVETNSGFSVAIGTDKSPEDPTRSTVFYLTSSIYNVESILYKGVRVKGVRAFLTVPWMQQYLQLSEKESVLEKYISLKTAGVWYKPVNEELKKLLNDLLYEQNTPLLFYQNKITRIIELFFEWLYDEMQLLTEKSGISRHDIEMAQKVENILTADVTRIPPTVKELARQAAMSESKLKKIFKAVYGQPPYEYFQNQRMQKAKIMLLSGNYSVKDIGYTLGYANLSNFTLAFKKVFGQLPSDILRTRTKGDL